MYLTPNRFRTMAFGVDLTDHTDLEIRSVIDQASQLVNTYCSVPLTPARHDFRGGVVIGEQHNWNLPTLDWSSFGTGRRIYPYHAPIKTVTGFKVKFTNTYEIDIDPANLYVNKAENWAEVVALASVVSGVYPVGINFGLYSPVAEIDYTYGWQFAVVDEVLSPTDSTVVYQAANQFWLSGGTTEVKVDGVVETAYTGDPIEGTVTFDDPQAGDAVVTLSYTYTLPSPIAAATGHLASTLLNEGDLVSKGLGNLASLRVEEVELRRSYRPDSTQALIQTLDPAVAIYLNDFVYVTVR